MFLQSKRIYCDNRFTKHPLVKNIHFFVSHPYKSHRNEPETGMDNGALYRMNNHNQLLLAFIRPFIYHLNTNSIDSKSLLWFWDYRDNASMPHLGITNKRLGNKTVLERSRLVSGWIGASWRHYIRINTVIRTFGQIEIYRMRIGSFLFGEVVVRWGVHDLSGWGGWKGGVEKRDGSVRFFLVGCHCGTGCFVDSI